MKRLGPIVVYSVASAQFPFPELDTGIARGAEASQILERY